MDAFQKGYAFLASKDLAWASFHKVSLSKEFHPNCMQAGQQGHRASWLWVAGPAEACPLTSSRDQHADVAENK